MSCRWEQRGTSPAISTVLGGRKHLASILTKYCGVNMWCSFNCSLFLPLTLVILRRFPVPCSWLVFVDPLFFYYLPSPFSLGACRGIDKVGEVEVLERNILSWKYTEISLFHREDSECLQYLSRPLNIHVFLSQWERESITQRNCKHLKVIFVFQGFSIHWIPE